MKFLRGFYLRYIQGCFDGVHWKKLFLDLAVFAGQLAITVSLVSGYVFVIKFGLEWVETVVVIEMPIDYFRQAMAQAVWFVALTVAYAGIVSFFFNAKEIYINVARWIEATARHGEPNEKEDQV
ncbi:hypothetical protein ACRZ5S_22910 (plasmid) [Vibrio scophthalmi]|uniref:hypothetical protein n=1 Tax=Vibrio scophthalmi TaxID=45658 RepID=UPI003EC02731